MKNSILLLFAFILFCSSCKQTNETKSPSNPKKTNPSEEAIPDCFSSYQIYTETAFMWQTGWVSYYDSIRSEQFDNSPRVSFDAQSLNNLYNEVKSHEDDHPGILMWYTLINPDDTFPSLAIQNTVGCEIDPDGTILLASGNDPSLTVSSITQAYLNTIKQSWDISGIQTPGVFTPVNGYNYQWESIQNLMNLSAGPQGINIHYGLRTIGPNESEYYEVLGNPNKTGSIVYCNILYGDNFEVNPLANLLDFAMPCPRFCGDIKTF